jgi:hypothetical protein
MRCIVRTSTSDSTHAGSRVALIEGVFDCQSSLEKTSHGRQCVEVYVRAKARASVCPTGAAGNWSVCSLTTIVADCAGSSNRLRARGVHPGCRCTGFQQAALTRPSCSASVCTWVLSDWKKAAGEESRRFLRMVRVRRCPDGCLIDLVFVDAVEDVAQQVLLARLAEDQPVHRQGRPRSVTPPYRKIEAKVPPQADVYDIASHYTTRGKSRQSHCTSEESQSGFNGLGSGSYELGCSARGV